MRSVQDVLGQALATVGPVPPLDVVLDDAAGCVLVDDLRTEAAVPAQPLAACDGYALRAQDTETARTTSPVTLPVAHDVPVVAADRLRLVPGTAVRIASGALLPEGADAVVPLDATDRGAARVTLAVPTAPGEGVRAAGSDAPAGEVLVPGGTRLAARHLALAATVGRARLRVHPTPRVVVVSAGDELVAPHAVAHPGAVHDANGHALAAAVQDAGAHAFRVGPLGDDRRELREAVEDQLVRADLLLAAGGLSPEEGGGDGGAVGRRGTGRDSLREVLAPLGEMTFDDVAMEPGRRQGFGTVAGVPVFALPGRPAAALVVFEVLVRPVLRAMGGHTSLHRRSVTATAVRGWRSPVGVRQFVPATLTGGPEEYTVSADGTTSTASLARANALAVVPETVGEVRAGDAVPCLVLGD